jgi:ribosome-associated translation inhibitor RaiA
LRIGVLAAIAHRTPPRSGSSQRVVITSYGTGPAVRAEAGGASLPAVIDEAISTLESRLRRNHDRRVHRRSQTRRTTIGAGPA